MKIKGREEVDFERKERERKKGYDGSSVRVEDGWESRLVRGIRFPENSPERES